jgi:thiamine biosynthesis lipoprotein
MKNITRILIGISALFLLASCDSPESNLIRRTQFIMGTLVEITLAEEKNDKNQQAIDLAFDEMSRLEGLMSTHLPDAEIYKLNQQAGKGFMRLSPDVLKVLQRAMFWSEQSGGAFDVTIGPVTKLWRFGDEKPSIPSSVLLQQALQTVDYKNIHIDDVIVRLNKPGMALHLGAIAKGYAVDHAMMVLKSNGIQNAMINAGGDLTVIGNRAVGKPWKIGLQHPRKPEKIIASFNLADGSVATSGDYQRYFIHDKKRYHHILNPENGQPARGLISATVITSSTIDADALATAVFVLGAEKGMLLIDSLGGAEGMVILESGEALFSKNLQSESSFKFKGF